MTMDIYQRAMRADSSPPLAVDMFHERSASAAAAAAAAASKCQKSVKRSFDVAFLMAPDDLMRRRREAADQPQPYQQTPLRLTVHSSPPVAADDRIGEGPHSPPRARVVLRSAFTKVVVNSGCVHAPPTLEPFPRTPPVPLSPSSASSTASNHSGLSPDLIAYQDSLSPQPFVPSRSPVHPLPTKHHTNAHPLHYQPPTPQHANLFLKKDAERYTPPHGIPATTTTTTTTNAAASNLQFFISNSLINDAKADGAASLALDDRVSGFEAELSKRSGRYSALAKHNLPFQADNGVGVGAGGGGPYPSFPVTAAAAFPFSTTLVPVAAAAAAAAAAVSNSVPMFPAAALLPSSLAAFTLPAQNVCAKCNMHFRMTSDLVYHMRSQHKNENAAADTYKRRRDQDKLKCPVCRESFRERHHLTRHMTAHQDKEDEEEAAAAAAVAAAASAAVAAAAAASNSTTTAITKDLVDMALQRAPISGSAAT